MILQEFIRYYITSKNGWAIADQFEYTFENENFEEQNYNALGYIDRSISELLKSDLLSENAFNELETYSFNLKKYLTS